MSNKNELEELNAILKDVDELKQRAINLKAKLEKSEEPKAWKPENHEEYWFIRNDGSTSVFNWKDLFAEQLRYDVGNCFQTKKRAEQVAEKFRALLKLERCHDIFCPDFVPDWNDDSQIKFFVDFHTADKKWCVFNTNINQSLVEVYFSSRDIAKKVCDLLNQEESE